MFFVEFDPTLNKDYLILSYLICQGFTARVPNLTPVLWFSTTNTVIYTQQPIINALFIFYQSCWWLGTNNVHGHYRAQEILYHPYYRRVLPPPDPNPPPLHPTPSPPHTKKAKFLSNSLIGPLKHNLCTKQTGMTSTSYECLSAPCFHLGVSRKAVASSHHTTARPQRQPVLY